MNFYKLKVVATKLKIRIVTLMCILGRVRIDLPKNKEDGEGLQQPAETLDLGLNVINQFKNMLVPELVRLPKAYSDVVGRSKFE